MEERVRRSMLISARLRREDEDEFRAVLLKDVSANGAKVKGGSGLPLGSGVHIDLPKIGVVAATVIWERSGLTGLRFEVPIEPKELRTTISGEYKRPSAPPDGTVKRLF
jgi:hypothetical protein